MAALEGGRRDAAGVRHDHRLATASSMGTEGMKYSLVSREVIADSIETACNGQCDGRRGGRSAAATRTCRAAMIGDRAHERPGIFVYGGTIKPGH